MNKLAKKLINQYRRFMFKRNMDGFIPVAENGRWLHRFPPTKSLNKTATLFNEMGGSTIIEMGTGIHGKMAGNSMLIWPKKTRAKRIIAIDLDQQRLDEVNEVTRDCSNVELVLADGIDYLQNFTEKIDLLYLDFWTPDAEGELPGTCRAESHKKAFSAAIDKLNDHSMILIDDTDHEHPWKHTYIVPLARQNGFILQYTGRQTLLKR